MQYNTSSPSGYMPKQSRVRNDFSFSGLPPVNGQGSVYQNTPASPGDAMRQAFAPAGWENNKMVAIPPGFDRDKMTRINQAQSFASTPQRSPLDPDASIPSRTYSPTPLAPASMNPYLMTPQSLAPTPLAPASMNPYLMTPQSLAPTPLAPAVSPQRNYSLYDYNLRSSELPPNSPLAKQMQSSQSYAMRRSMAPSLEQSQAQVNSGFNNYQNKAAAGLIQDQRSRDLALAAMQRGDLNREGVYNLLARSNNTEGGMPIAQLRDRDNARAAANAFVDSAVSRQRLWGPNSFEGLAQNEAARKSREAQENQDYYDANARWHQQKNDERRNYFNSLGHDVSHLPDNVVRDAYMQIKDQELKNARMNALQSRLEQDPGFADRAAAAKAMEANRIAASRDMRMRQARWDQGMVRPGEEMQYALVRGAMQDPSNAMRAYGEGIRGLGYNDMMRDTAGIRANADMFGDHTRAMSNIYGHNVARENARDTSGLARDRFQYEQNQALRKETLETNPHIAGLKAAEEARARGMGQAQIDAAYRAAAQAAMSARQDLGIGGGYAPGISQGINPFNMPVRGPLPGLGGGIPQSGYSMPDNPIRQDPSLIAEQAMSKPSFDNIDQIASMVAKLKQAGMRPEEIRKQIGTLDPSTQVKLQQMATYPELSQDTWDSFFQPSTAAVALGTLSLPYVMSRKDKGPEDKYMQSLDNSRMNARAKHGMYRDAHEILTGYPAEKLQRSWPQFLFGM